MRTESTGGLSTATLYLKAITPSWRRAANLPEDQHVTRVVSIEWDHLAKYNEICGFTSHNEIPATYPHVLGFDASLRLMSGARFPFSPLGLLHSGNTIRQLRPLEASDSLSQRVWAENLRNHAMGRQFDIVTETSTGGEVVWRETSTYARRGPVRGPRPQGGATILAPGGESTEVWRVAADQGRRYAGVSGDRNPIHLYACTATLFGLSRAIAHGMWLKARCLAALEDVLPRSYAVWVEFRRPVLQPCAVEFVTRSRADGRAFTVRSMTGKTHLAGFVREDSRML